MLELSTFKYGCLVRGAYQAGEEAEAGRDAPKSNLCLISHRWYDVKKLTVRGSSNLNLHF